MGITYLGMPLSLSTYGIKASYCEAAWQIGPSDRRCRQSGREHGASNRSLTRSENHMFLDQSRVMTITGRPSISILQSKWRSFCEGNVSVRVYGSHTATWSLYLEKNLSSLLLNLGWKQWTWNDVSPTTESGFPFFFIQDFLFHPRWLIYYTDVLTASRLNDTFSRMVQCCRQPNHLKFQDVDGQMRLQQIPYTNRVYRSFLQPSRLESIVRMFQETGNYFPGYRARFLIDQSGIHQRQPAPQSQTNQSAQGLDWLISQRQNIALYTSRVQLGKWDCLEGGWNQIQDYQSEDVDSTWTGKYEPGFDFWDRNTLCEGLDLGTLNDELIPALISFRIRIHKNCCNVWTIKNLT